MIFIEEIFHRFLHTEPHLFVVLPCMCVVPGCVEVHDNPWSFCAVDLREGGEGREKKGREGGKKRRRQEEMEDGRGDREVGRKRGSNRRKGTVRNHVWEGKRRMDTMSQKKLNSILHTDA
jgi:hypothetical protein